MKHTDCTQCQEWELCPFHGDDAPPSTERAVEAISTPDPVMTCDVCGAVGNARFYHPNCCSDEYQAVRLLGPDDPEVSNDLIYATPTGGVVAVPR